MVNNEIFNYVKKYIDNNCMIFNADSLKNILELKLNEENFLNSIPKNIPIQKQIDQIETIAREKQIDCRRGIGILNEKQLKLSDSEKLDNLKLEIKNLNNELSDYKGQRIDKLKQKFDNITSIYNSLDDNTDLNLSTLIDDCKEKLDIITRNYVSDEKYLHVCMEEFKKNHIWLSKNGNFTNNLFFNRPYESNADFNLIPIDNCLNLYNSEKKIGKIYSPLIARDKLYYSKDSKSVTCYNLRENKEEFKLDLKENIISSGCLMRINNIYLITVTNKNVIVSLDDKVKAKFPIDNLIGTASNYEIRSVESFSNVFYMVLNIYDFNYSYIISGFYDYSQDRFKMVQPVKESSIVVGNISFNYSNDIETPNNLVYFTADNKLKFLNVLSNTLQSESNVSYIPYVVETARGRIYTNVVTYSDSIYYVSKNNGRLYLAKLSYKSSLNPVAYELPSEFLVENGGILIPNISNFCIYDDDGTLFMNCKTLFKQTKYYTIKISKGLSISSQDEIQKASGTILVYNNNRKIHYVANKNSNNRLDIVAMYNDRVICFESNKTDYTLYISE